MYLPCFAEYLNQAQSLRNFSRLLFCFLRPRACRDYLTFQNTFSSSMRAKDSQSILYNMLWKRSNMKEWKRYFIIIHNNHISRLTSLRSRRARAKTSSLRKLWLFLELLILSISTIVIALNIFRWEIRDFSWEIEQLITFLLCLIHERDWKLLSRLFRMCGESLIVVDFSSF